MNYSRQNHRQQCNSCSHNENSYRYSATKTSNYKNSCISLDELPLAIAYVPWQQWENVYCGEEGLSEGTIFPELVLPFYGCDYKNVRGNRG